MFKRKHKTNNDVNVIVVSDNELVAQLNDIHTNEIIPEAIEKAKDDATKSLPSTKTKSSVHFEFLTSRYNRLVLEYKSKSNINEQQYSANKDIVQFKKLRIRLKEKLSKVTNDLRLKTRSKENLKSNRDVIRAYYKALVGVYLLSGSEALFASSSFQIFVQNIFFSLLIGLTFAAALYFSAVIGAKILRMARNRWQFTGIMSAILTVVGTVFLLLGYFRQIFLSQMYSDCDSCYQLSPINFMLIQLFFYVCALLLKYFFLPTKSEFKSYNDWKEAKHSIIKLTKAKTQLEGSIENMEQELDRTLITRRSLISRAADVELKIEALYKDAFNQYVKTNLHHRKSEDDIPICFEDKTSLPKLTMYFQDPKLLEFNEADLESHE